MPMVDSLWHGMKQPQQIILYTQVNTKIANLMKSKVGLNTISLDLNETYGDLKR